MSVKCYRIREYFLWEGAVGGSQAPQVAVEGGKGVREALRPTDRPVLVAELQRLLLVLFHLGLQLPHGVLELGVLPEEAPLTGSLLSGALRGACGAWAAPTLGRR